MAKYVPNANGNFSASGTWDTIVNTPTLAAGQVTVDTTARFTAGFTAPNTSNACTGVLVYINSIGTGGTVTVTLQESTVDTAAAKAINMTNLVVGTWVYFRFPTPYVFTTTGASAYRFKIQGASLSGPTCTFAPDSGGSNYAYLASEDIHAVPGVGDDIFITSQNQSGNITVTMDGTQSIGSEGDVALISGITTLRSLGYAINICNGGVLSFDTTATSQLTCKGKIVVGLTGEVRIATSGSPLSNSYTATLIFNMTTTQTQGVVIINGGKWNSYGIPKSSTSLWKTTYVSGTGVAASPLVTADAVDWNVGDEIVIASTGTTSTAYQESENKFIKTKNSSTSYVLADTAGGAESAFTYTHTTSARIFNLQRNITIQGISTSLFATFWNLSTTAGDVNLSWTNFNNTGNNTAQGINIIQAAAGRATMDYCVSRGNANNIRHHFLFSNNTVAQTFTGNIVANGGGAAAPAGGFLLSSSSSITFVDCIAIKCSGSGFNIVSSYGNTFTRCIAISCDLGAGAFGGYYFSGGGSNIFTDCEAHANRTRALYLQGGGVDTQFLRLLCGTKGVNAIDVDIVAATYNTFLFNNCLFGSATLINGYTGLLVGSEIKFSALNQTDNNNRWYTPYGSAQMTGASLTDTTTRTAGNYATRLSPENNSTGFYWDFYIPSPKSNIINFFCYAQKNAAFGPSTAKIELYLPGLVPGVDTPSDTQTLTNDTGTWQAVSLSANYTSTTVDGLATVRFTGITATSAAYLYIADLFNADSSTIQALGGLRVWANGKPSPLINTATLSAGDVWTYDTSNLTTTGTTGKKLVDNLTTARFIGLK